MCQVIIYLEITLIEKNYIIKILSILIFIIFAFFSCEKKPTEPEIDDIIEEFENSAPIISSLTAERDTILIVDTLAVTCIATDSDNDILKYSWSSTAGSISSIDSQVAVFIPPAAGTIVKITCSVIEADSGKVWTRESIDIVVNRWLTGTVKDVDGNSYKTVKIGDQWWMAENLKVTHYRDGTEIPNVLELSDWKSLTTGAYSYLFNDINYIDIYGNLYNWYAVDDSSQIAPEGWHVASDEDWKVMEMYLGMSRSDADNTGLRGVFTDILSSTHEPDEEYCSRPSFTNLSGFTGSPGGKRGPILDYSDLIIGKEYYWTSTTRFTNSLTSWYRYMHCGYNLSEGIVGTPGIGRWEGPKNTGFSVRCVKN